jgi:hypothetical protein
LSWFFTLPLWLGLEGLRVVHAAWHPASMDVLRDQLTPQRQLASQLLVAGIAQRNGRL